MFKNANVGISTYINGVLHSFEKFSKQSDDKCLAIFSDLLKIVQSLHQNQIVCGNIKPETICQVVSYENSERIEKLKLLDFSNFFPLNAGLADDCQVKIAPPGTCAEEFGKQNERWKPTKLDYWGLERVGSLLFPSPQGLWKDLLTREGT